MADLDLLLHIDSYPTPTPDRAIEDAVRLAVGLGGKLTGLAIEVAIPVHSNQLADYLIGLSAMAEQEERRSREACNECLGRFAAAAKAANVFQAMISARINHFAVGDHVAKVARTHDLCLIPIAAGTPSNLELVQAVVFGSGRPVLIFRVGQASGLSRDPDLVVVAWDGGQRAARAMADALPILARAKRVRILSVINEKPGRLIDPGAAAQAHLARHGVASVLDSVDAEAGAIGKVLDQYVEKHAPDLLVMGAYGHSRAREFLLGGATEHVLKTPPCPVLLSH